MTNKHIAYIRVSTLDQNSERQQKAIEDLEQGIQIDKYFIDTASGKDIKRPKLEDLLLYVREGDVLIVHSMDRLARNLTDLKSIVSNLNSRGVTIKFLKEKLAFNPNEDSPVSNLMLSIMGGFAEFERSLIKERQQEGIALAKQRGAYTGRKKALSNSKLLELKQQLTSQKTKTQIAKEFGISRETLYQYVRGMEEK